MKKQLKGKIVMVIRVSKIVIGNFTFDVVAFLTLNFKSELDSKFLLANFQQKMIMLE